MKQNFLIVILLFFYAPSFAETITAQGSQNNSKWNVADTWDLHRVPTAGDTVVIPTGSIVVLDNVENISGDLHIKIYGTLRLVGGKLSVDAGSKLEVFGTGMIKGQGPGSSNSIKIGNKVKYGMYDDAIFGPSYADKNTANSPNGFKSSGSSVTLPVQFLNFSVARKNKDVVIEWSTTQEVAANMYELERSYDGSNWSTIAYISAIGNTSATNNYAYSDKNITKSTVHYRIKQVDADSKYTYTAIRSIREQVQTGADVKIAAAQNKIILQFPGEVKGTVVVRLLSLNGQIVSQQTVTQPSGNLMLHSPAVAKGTYVVSVSNGQDIQIAKQIIL